MDRSDYYITPGKAELAGLCRSYASMSKTLFESEDEGDRAAAPAYNLGAEAWRSMHGTEDDAVDPAVAIAAMRASAREDGVDQGLVEGVIEEMERVLLRGYKDTVGMVPGADAASTPTELDAGLEPAVPMSAIDIFRRQQEAGVPVMAPTLTDEERVGRTAAALGLVSKGFAPPRQQRRSR
jgi:hypothetical protein